MSIDTEWSRLAVDELALRVRREMIPLTARFSYFSTLPVAEEDLRQYLNDPIAAISPAIVAGLPHMGIILAPYIEKGNGKGGDCVTFERPSESRHIPCSLASLEGLSVMALGIKDIEVADYHYRFYRTIAELVSGPAGENVSADYTALIRGELAGGAHGEVDEESWRVKSELTARERAKFGHSKRCRTYIRRSFIDTLTLYLHGICCDIDVETGPRQLPSRFLRRRLQLLNSIFPPPEGYAVFPEDLKK